MIENAARVLLIEDNPADVLLVRAMLAEAGGACCEVECTDRLAKGLERLATEHPHVVLVDLSLPDSHGLETFTRIHTVAPHMPVIVLTAQEDEQLAAKALQLGAQDYLVKQQITAPLLMRAIRYAIGRQRSQDAQARDRRMIETLMDNIPDAIYFKDTQSRFLRINRYMADKFKLKDPSEADGKTDADIFSAGHAQQARADEEKVMHTGQPLVGIEEKETWPDGSMTWVNSTKMPLRDEHGRVIGTYGISRDITKRKAAQRALAERTRQLQEKNNQIENELKMARELQMAMLPHGLPRIPPDAPAGRGALEFVSVYIPAGTVSGDFFHVVQISDTAAAVFIGDVMGHDVRAALVTAMLRAEVEDLSRLIADPGQLLTQINRDLAGIFKESGAAMFATAFYMVADVATGQLSCANAGHPPPVRLNRASGLVEPLRLDAERRPDPALGLIENTVFTTCQRPMADGDLIVLFTDGVIEAETANEEPYGHERLMAAMRAHGHLPTEKLLCELIADARRFSGRHDFVDDVCLVGMDVSSRFKSSA